MRRPEQRRQRHQLVALGERGKRAAAEQPGADGRQGHRRPHDRVGNFAAPAPGDERRDDHIQRSEEAGIGDGGSSDASLLQPGGNKKCCAARNGNRQKSSVEAGLLAPVLAQRQRRESKRGNGPAGRNERQRPDVVHRRLLEHEREAPDDGRKQQGDVGVQAGAEAGHC